MPLFHVLSTATPTTSCRPNWNAAAAKQLCSCISCCRCQGSKVGTGLVGVFTFCSVCLCSLFVYKQMTRNPLGRVHLGSGGEVQGVSFRCRHVSSVLVACRTLRIRNVVPPSWLVDLFCMLNLAPKISAHTHTHSRKQLIHSYMPCCSLSFTLTGYACPVRLRAANCSSTDCGCGGYCRFCRRRVVVVWRLKTQSGVSHVRKKQQQ